MRYIFIHINADIHCFHFIPVYTQSLVSLLQFEHLHHSHSSNGVNGTKPPLSFNPSINVYLQI